MKSQFGAYGEMNKSWTADDAKGFIKVSATAQKIYQSIKVKND